MLVGREQSTAAPTAALFRPDRASDEPIVQPVLLPKASIVHVCKKAEKGRGSIIRATPLCYQVNLCSNVDRTLIKTLCSLRPPNHPSLKYDLPKLPPRLCYMC